MIRSASLDSPYQTAFTNGSHEAVADVPVEKGGTGKGFGPHELLEAAFATCLTMTVQMYAAKYGFPLQAARCEVRIDRSVPDAVTLNYTLSLDGPLLTDEQLVRLREAAGRCPVARTLSGAIALRPVPQEGAG
jgi:putative redox protein